MHKRILFPILYFSMQQMVFAEQSVGMNFQMPMTETPIEQHQASKGGSKKREKKPIDPLEVSDVALKGILEPSVRLPGVMGMVDKTTGNRPTIDFNKTRIVDMSNDDNPTIYLSVDNVNRIQLPFSPRVIASDGLTIKTSNNNLYVNFNANVTQAIQIYVENPNSSATLGLQLVPKKISAQTIIVQDSRGVGGVTTVPLKGNDYTTNIQGVMESLALGSPPQGYSKARLDFPPIVMTGFVVQPLEKYAGSDNDVFIYEVNNALKIPITLRESDFDGPSVMAISISPKPHLDSGEKARVFVIARKNGGQ